MFLFKENNMKTKKELEAAKIFITDITDKYFDLCEKTENEKWAQAYVRDAVGSYCFGFLNDVFTYVFPLSSENAWMTKYFICDWLDSQINGKINDWSFRIGCGHYGIVIKRDYQGILMIDTVEGILTIENDKRYEPDFLLKRFSKGFEILLAHYNKRV